MYVKVTCANFIQILMDFSMEQRVKIEKSFGGHRSSDKRDHFIKKIPWVTNDSSTH